MIKMEYNEKNILILENYIDAYIETMKNKYIKIPAIQDKIEHIKRATLLVEKIAPKNKLAQVATKYHDIGRFMQYELLGNFDDNIISHHTLGENIIIKEIIKGNLIKSYELDVIRLVVMYHGMDKYIPLITNLDSNTQKIIDIVSRVDGIENGCIGALGYLERECKEDAKNYKKNNPTLDMKKVSKDVFNFYLNGEKFDKIKYCKTYADYILFASTLAITALKKDRKVAKEALELKCFQYNNAIEGYKDLFEKMIEPDLVNECINCLEGFYQNPNWRN